MNMFIHHRSLSLFTAYSSCSIAVLATPLLSVSCCLPPGGMDAEVHHFTSSTTTRSHVVAMSSLVASKTMAASALQPVRWWTNDVWEVQWWAL